MLHFQICTGDATYRRGHHSVAGITLQMKILAGFTGRAGQVDIMDVRRQSARPHIHGTCPKSAIGVSGPAEI
jgi:hypothetical protein